MGTNPEHVERLQTPSRSCFERDYVGRNKPLILTGVANRWRAIAEWNVDYFKRIAGPTVITTRFDEHADHMSYYKPKVDPPREMTFAAYLDGLVADPPETRHHLAPHRVQECYPALSGDVDCSDYMDESVSVLFIGRDTFSPNHYHGRPAAPRGTGWKTQRHPVPNASAMLRTGVGPVLEESGATDCNSTARVD